MSNKYEVGQVIKGKVTDIKPFGAFVALDEQIQGLVHISEVAHSYVKNIADVLTVGQEIDVKILSIDEAKRRYSLSIRATVEAPKKEEKPKRRPRKRTFAPSSTGTSSEGYNLLEQKLKEALGNNN